MHGHPFGHTDADGGNLVVTQITTNPDAAAAVDPFTGNVESLEQVDDDAFESSDVSHDIYRIGKSDNGITHQLTGAVPSDFAASIDVNNFGAVRGAFIWLSALTRCVDARVLE